MRRRDFLKAGLCGLAGGALPLFADGTGGQALRVALIGTGWYGKVDLFRLLQVAPVEVAAL